MVNDIINLFKGKIGLFLKELIGDYQFEYEYSSLDFRKTIGKEHFVLKVHINNGDYKYVALTNLLLPSSMKRKGLSMEIINLLVNLCNVVNYDCYITEITNEGWKEGLLKHGGLEDEVGDVLINREKWIEKHNYKQLKFIKVDADLILQSEAEQYSNIKKKCITEVINIFTSWQAKMDIAQPEGYVEQIIAEIGDETYYVLFSHNTINYIHDLLNENQLENHLKEHKSIGLLF